MWALNVLVEFSFAHLSQTGYLHCVRFEVFTASEKTPFFMTPALFVGKPTVTLYLTNF
jgi:hypothetical protein